MTEQLLKFGLGGCELVFAYIIFRSLLTQQKEFIKMVVREMKEHDFAMKQQHNQFLKGLNVLTENFKKIRNVK